MKNRFRLPLSVLGLTGLLCLSALPANAEKLLDFSFDGTGNSEASGRGATAKLSVQLFDAKGSLSNIRSAPGTGVSGKPWDTAFDGSSATGMGKAQDPTATNLGPVAIADAATSALSSLVSYTITGWIKSDLPVEMACRIVSGVFTSGNKGLIELYGTSTPSGLTLSVTPSPQAETSNRSNTLSGSYPTNGEWVFFAVTFSGIGDKPQAVQFFKGSKATATTSVSANTVAGQTSSEPSLLTIGNLKNRQRPVKGLIDNLRIYGSTTDASGALTLAQLEELRLKDVAGVPTGK